MAIAILVDMSVLAIIATALGLVKVRRLTCRYMWLGALNGFVFGGAAQKLVLPITLDK
jgi:hypothetical protein